MRRLLITIALASLSAVPAGAQYPGPLPSDQAQGDPTPPPGWDRRDAPPPAYDGQQDGQGSGGPEQGYGQQQPYDQQGSRPADDRQDRDAPPPPYAQQDRDAPPPYDQGRDGQQAYGQGPDQQPLPDTPRPMPAPIYRQPQERGLGGLGNAGQRLGERRTQDAVAAAVGAMADAVMDIRIDRIRDAARGVERGYGQPQDRYARGNEPRTLGEVIARDDPNFRARLQDNARAAVAGVGAAARTAATLEPALRQVADDFARAVEGAIARANEVGR